MQWIQAGGDQQPIEANSREHPARGSLGGDRLFDARRLPGAGCLDEGGEDGAGEGAHGVGALGVPLDGDDELVGRIELDGFDDAVGGGDGADAEVVADFVDGLVVAGVDLGRAPRRAGGGWPGGIRERCGRGGPRLRRGRGGG